MIKMPIADDGDRVQAYRVGVDFTVAARSEAEARSLADRLLDQEASDGFSFLAGERFSGEVSDRVLGILDWQKSPSPTPPQLYIGVIRWTDRNDEYPELYAEADREKIAVHLATSVHDTLVESDETETFAGAYAFLDRHPLPLRHFGPGEADAWLQALHEATPYPSVTIHRPDTSALTPGPVSTQSRSAANSLEASADLAATQDAAAQEQLYTYAVPVDFSVSARTAGEARRMVDDALVGAADPASQAMVQRNQQVHADGDVEGVLGWQHHEESLSPSSTAGDNHVAGLLQQRENQVSLDGTDRSDARRGKAWPGPAI